MTKELKKITIRINSKDWEIFKKISKYYDSDSNKELRKLISSYLTQRPDLYKKFKRELKKS